MALTDTAVRQAKATGTAYTLGDIDGLSLAVSPHGGKSWHFRYYWMGKQKRMSLGTYPKVSLREARQARDEARALQDREKQYPCQHITYLRQGRPALLGKAIDP
jgi:hypothetical protein